MTWEELQQWAREKGLDIEGDLIMSYSKEKSFYFYKEGKIIGSFTKEPLNVRVILGENKKTEQMKHFILALTEEE